MEITFFKLFLLIVHKISEGKACSISSFLKQDFKLKLAERRGNFKLSFLKERIITYF
jgi:hypothetical protein